mmetsp:Transcript_17714/g.38578  ORF Transcript_17714/g.38578 Transcript_17714/m.38578 type:complete len:270 (-) Transcript_17714:280-1089(-)
MLLPHPSVSPDSAAACEPSRSVCGTCVWMKFCMEDSSSSLTSISCSASTSSCSSSCTLSRSLLTTLPSRFSSFFCMLCSSSMDELALSSIRNSFLRPPSVRAIESLICSTSSDLFVSASSSSAMSLEAFSQFFTTSDRCTSSTRVDSRARAICFSMFSLSCLRNRSSVADSSPDMVAAFNSMLRTFRSVFAVLSDCFSTFSVARDSVCSSLRFSMTISDASICCCAFCRVPIVSLRPAHSTWAFCVSAVLLSTCSSAASCASLTLRISA